ncbi:MAG TPA: glycosyltransferase family 39 protein [Candidatus Omnitrophota bacterium]|nr:glycosyltransferase family 39 protein [Candidatus Omnitrophota bacterium]
MTGVFSVSRRNMIAAAIILAAIGIRFYNINGALFDFNPLRQAMGTAIARNYAQDPASSFLLPRVDNDGASPGYFMFELPVLPYSVSFIIRAAGDHNWVFRLPVIILFGLSAFYFFRLCVLISDDRTALTALVFYCIAPISILMSRVFQAESFMLLAMFVLIYHAIKWLRDERVVDLVTASLALTLFILLKLTNLYILVFIAALFLIFRKTRLIPMFLIPLTFVLAVNAWWWVIHSGSVRAAFPTEYTLVEGEAIFGPKFLISKIIENSFSIEFWRVILKQVSWVIFSPGIFILAILGCFSKKEETLKWVLFSWIFAAAAFIFLVPMASVQDYYKIHFLPPGAILAALGYYSVFGRIRGGFLKKTVKLFFWALVTVSIFVIVFPKIKYKPVFEFQEELGARVNHITGEKDLILTSFGPDAMLLYYCGRKGWSQYLPAMKGNIDLLEKRREEGADYFVCGNLDEFDSDQAFKEYLENNYRLVEAGERVYEEPEKGTFDRFLWEILALSGSRADGYRKKLERRSLGYVIYDLKEKL